MSQNLFFVLCAAHDDANAILRRKPLVSVVPPLPIIAAHLRPGHQLRWVKIESTKPYSTASGAERKRSRSVSRSICSRD
ncbi:hypothetical protein DWD20_17490 [Salmonella enterica]|nr:hypothetical protein [Salmonella enterica]EAW1146298.1 hypothetical protein [Salmonella enterica subsp. houtenae]EBR0108133.1 hypothetical protein [Salmonella enterica subsp. houtenae serovar Houten]EBX0545594.1 hypothetical protein [Salmonella enterica subsp. houtenae serovar 44:z4,z23:-]EDO5297696.1 hypothetical protein [Salmonella enterica subsp. houtenae serovar 40:z4,z24:-]